MVDELTALRLQLEWGADEALGDSPLDRFAPARPISLPRPAAVTLAAKPLVPDAAPPESIAALVAAWDAMTTHPLRATATHTVHPDGDPQARLVVIGEAPGSDDDRAGRAYSGPPGALLDRILGSAGFDRGSMLLTTISPWRPPGNRRLTEAETLSCLPFIRRLLAIVRPRHAILIGTVAMRALTGETGTARRVRGRFLPIQLDECQLSIDAMAMPALDQWLQNSAAKQHVWSQLTTLRRTVTTPQK